jgi:hypothetical protein
VTVHTFQDGLVVRPAAVHLAAAAVLLLPLSYAVKFQLGRPGITWIDPSLLLGTVLAGVLVATNVSRVGRVIRHASHWDSPALWVACFVAVYCLSTLIRWSPSAGTYDSVREVARLILSVNLAFSIYAVGLETRARRTLYWAFAASTIIEFAYALYLVAVNYWGLPMWPAGRAYVADYVGRQSYFVGSHYWPRLGGSFVESPIFGLYMLSAITVGVIALREQQRFQGWVLCTIGAAGAIAALADQVLFGLALGTILLLVASKRGVWVRALGVGLAVLVISVGAASTINKISAAQTGPVYGTSAGERWWHLRFGWRLVSDRLDFAIIGVGPGHYGTYAAQAGEFPDTVTPQNSLGEVLFETGAAGVLLALVAVGSIALSVMRRQGLFGLGLVVMLVVGDSLQSNWKFEALFVAVAILLAAPAYERVPSPRSGSEPAT